MKKILLSEYDESMGIFIEINENYHNVVKNSIHIPYENLLINYKELLDKSKKYYIYCKGGIKSRKVVNILSFYGYDVTLVY
jgi:rhodanese-related sulfurtransferase